MNNTGVGSVGRLHRRWPVLLKAQEEKDIRLAVGPESLSRLPLRRLPHVGSGDSLGGCQFVRRTTLQSDVTAVAQIVSFFQDAIVMDLAGAGLVPSGMIG